jgi:tetratricopeptide (TPR) repeat protein
MLGVKASSLSLPPRRTALPYLALVLAVLAAYANIYANGYVFDDGLLIARNQYLRSWSTFGHLFTAGTTDGAHVPGGFFRPVQNLLYFFVYQIFGHTPLGFHIADVGLHAANTCLLYALGLRLQLKPAAALAGTLIWAVHPIHTEAVTFISSMADPLYALFLLIGLLIVLPEVTARRCLLAAPVFILGLLSKETAVIFPALVTVCLFFVNPARTKLTTYLPTWPLWAIAGAYLLVRFTILSSYGAQNFDQSEYHYLKLYSEHLPYRVYTALATLPVYLGALLWPVGLHMERGFDVYMTPFDWRVAGGALLIIGAVAQIVWGRARRGLALSWGLLWAALAQAPNTGLLVPTNALFLEHWMYVPTMGLFLGVAQTLAPYAEKFFGHFRRIASAFVLLLALALGARTLDQNTVWHDSFTFYAYIFSFGEGPARAYNNLGIAYTEIGQFEKAEEQFRHAIRVSDTMAESHLNLGITLIHLPDREAHIPEAIEELKRAIAINPALYQPYAVLAIIYQEIGDGAEAQFYKQKAVEIRDR